jgi:hypothetical protein
MVSVGRRWITELVNVFNGRLYLIAFDSPEREVKGTMDCVCRYSVRVKTC